MRTNKKTNVTRNKGEHFTMTEGSVSQENKQYDICAPNNRSTKNTWRKTNKTKRKMYKAAIIVGRLLAHFA